jgi:cell division septum initiation protein DivIVA
MEREDDREKRVDQAVDEMRSEVEELEHRRDELEQYTKEARREAQRVKGAGPGTKGLKDEDEAPPDAGER